MIEQLFGSKTRVKMMKLFLDNPDQVFYVRELTRLTDSLINSVRRELENLEQIGFVKIVDKASFDDSEQKNDSDNFKIVNKSLKKYFQLNSNNFMVEELRHLFNKSRKLAEKTLAEKLQKVGHVNYLALSGVFIDDQKSPTDLIVVGNFPKKEMLEAIKHFETEIGRSLKYTIMDIKEYKLRRDIADRFINDIINNEQNMVIVDDLKILDL